MTTRTRGLDGLLQIAKDFQSRDLLFNKFVFRLMYVVRVFSLENSFFRVDRELCDGISQPFVANLGILEQHCPAYDQ